jgi:tetratricopeptide (TPR) repeat protein
VPEDLQLQLGAAEETVRLAEAAGDLSLLVAGRVWLVHERMAAGDPRGASAEIDEYVRLAGSLRVRLYPAYFFRAALAILEGRFDDGERLAREGLAAAEGSPWALDAGMSYGTQLALLRTEQGRTAEVEPMLKLFVARYPGLPGWRAGLAAVYAEEGRSAEAREQFEILAQRDFADVPRDLNWGHTMAVLAETCAHLRDVKRADRLYAILLPRAGRAVMVGYATGCWGSPSRWLGLLAETLSRPDEAARHFEDALAANAAMGARSWVARTQLDAARLLGGRDRPGDRAAARQLVAAGRAAAQELGMALVAERASALERALAG